MSLIRRIQQNTPEPLPEPRIPPAAPAAVAVSNGHHALAEEAAIASFVPEMDQLAAERRRQLLDWMLERLWVDMDEDNTNKPDAQRLLASRFQELYRQSHVTLSLEEQKLLFQEVVDEILGFGPLEQLIRDDSISEIMVNGPESVFVERQGKLVESGVLFRDDAHVQRVIERIIRPLGRHIDRKWPIVDARLPDGSRVNAIIPPCAIDGSSITIRKFPKGRLGVEDLIRYGSVTPQMAEFLRACVVSHLNIVVSGGTGSGKTTLLNILSGFIPDGERIVTIEDSAELQLQQRHVVRLETKNPEIDGTGRVSIRDLVVNSLRMRPDRIVVGECRSGEALDMLQAMNTGHDGSLTTTHANTPRDCISRLETLCLMSGVDLPQKVVREQIASAIDLIIQQSRLRDGSRKITAVTEVQGMEGDTIVMQDIFRFEEKGMDSNNKVVGEFRPLGVRPRFTPRLEASGFNLPAEVFSASGPRRLY
ncbi:MAG TPA: CpaF family protein [Ardenticatenaceae bacterium]|jgi:pilus assembly protein CpaF